MPRRQQHGLILGYGRVPAQDVEDIVQTTFVRLYDRIDSLRDPNALFAWLDTTARRETLKCIRAARRERPLDGGILENLPAPHELDERPTEALDAEFDQAIERLPGRSGQRGWRAVRSR